MPTYEYECTQCSRRFEHFQSITAKPLKRMKTDCTECKNSAPVKRLIGAGAAVVFKGSGFYQTDYRSDAYKKAAKAETEGGATGKGESGKDAKAKTDTASKTEGKSDSKPGATGKDTKK